MVVNTKSLENLNRSGSAPTKYEAKSKSFRLSRPCRHTLAATSDLYGSETELIELLPELLLTLAECAKHISPETALGRRLESLKVSEAARSTATLEVLGDDEGDCTLCGSTGYDFRVGPDCNCIACGGVGDFLEHPDYPDFD